MSVPDASPPAPGPESEDETRRNRISLLVLLAVAALIIAAGGIRLQSTMRTETSYKNATATSAYLTKQAPTLAHTPTLVPVAELCAHTGDMITLMGTFKMSSVDQCTDEACLMDFVEAGQGQEAQADAVVRLAVGDGPNTMEKLPPGFAASALRVHADDGQVVGFDELVSLTGLVVRGPADAHGCQLNVDTIHIP